MLNTNTNDAGPLGAFPDEPELHPDLRPWLRDGPLGPMLHHPLGIHLVVAPHLYGVINEGYRQRRKRMEAARDAGEWAEMLGWVEKPYRAWMLHLVQDRIQDDQEYWSLVGEVWQLTEWPGLDEHMRALLASDRPGREHLMSDDEDRDIYRELPERLTLYRGCWPEHVWHPSWTLSRRKATWFARRLSTPEKPCALYELRDWPKSSTLAHFGGRGEQEVVLDLVPRTEDQLEPAESLGEEGHIWHPSAEELDAPILTHLGQFPERTSAEDSEC